MDIDGNCVFCNEQETRNHLFFECQFSQGIWSIMRRCGLNRRILSWENEVKWAVERLKGKALISTLLKIAWTAFIYNVWRERNGRVFAQKYGSDEQIISTLKRLQESD